MSFGGFSEPFIRRPVGTTLLAIGLFLVGAVAYRFLPVASMPTVDFPTINVNATRPGADPETMAATVAAPLERRGHRAHLAQLAGIHPHHHSIRSRPQDRWRCARCAGGHQRGADRPARRSAGNADFSQVESGGDPDHDPGIDVEGSPTERAL